MSNGVVSFKESKIFGITFVIFILSFLVSFLPHEDYKLFAITTGFTILCFITFVILWKYNKHDSVRYFSLLSYVMINAYGILAMIPLLRMSFGTITFWIGLVTIIVLALLPYLSLRKTAMTILRPYKSKVLGKLYAVYVPLVLTFGGFLFIDALNTGSDSSIYLYAIFCYLLAILFFFVAPILLLKKEDIDQIQKQA